MLRNFLKEYLVPLNSSNGSILECRIKLSADFGILSCPPVEDEQTNLTSIAAELIGFRLYFRFVVQPCKSVLSDFQEYRPSAIL